MVMSTHNPSTSESQEDWEFGASLGYVPKLWEGREGEKERERNRNF